MQASLLTKFQQSPDFVKQKTGQNQAMINAGENRVTRSMLGHG